MMQASGCRKNRSLRSARGLANPHFVGRVGVGRQRRIRKNMQQNGRKSRQNDRRAMRYRI